MMKKNCEICKGEINLSTDNYVIIDDYYRGEFLKRGYYHNTCYNNLLNLAKQNVKEMTFNVVDSARKLVSNVVTNSSDKQVYEIK